MLGQPYGQLRGAACNDDASLCQVALRVRVRLLGFPTLSEGSQEVRAGLFENPFYDPI